MNEELRNFFGVLWANTKPSESGLGLGVTNFSTLMSELYRERVEEVFKNPLFSTAGLWF